jgi:2-C-methyl-D-erythritol 4-phosphate cytidylyltransferase
MMKRYVIIVAGGKGLRMGGDIPKQFVEIKGLPVLMHTINRFHSFDSSIDIIVALPVDQQDYWKELCSKYKFEIPHTIVDGGDTRFHSVKNGLDQVSGEGVVAVHDGVRPFVSDEVLERCFSMAQEKEAVVPVIDVFETIRHIADGMSNTVPRDEYKLVQTPQVFLISLLKKAYSQPYVPSFTDDASVVEAMGYKVTLVEGNRENIKLTTPFDLKLAELLSN